MTARAVMNKQNKMLEVDVDGNNEELDEISRQINRINKTIRRRKQKCRKYRELSARLNELNKSKSDIRNKVDALKQTISHIEVVKDEGKLKIKELKKKNKKLS